jgi:cytochrome c556
MKCKVSLAAAVFIVATTSLAAADSEIIVLRQLIMKTNDQSGKVAIGMIKGEIPFDATVAAAAVLQISHGLEDFPQLFPAGTETGNNTSAAPAIWSNPDDFKAKARVVIEAAAAAAAAAADGPEAFGAAVQAVGAGCDGCHETYRLR